MSQAGYVICLATRVALTGEAPESVLAAEACAANAGIDHSMFLSCCLSEVVYGIPATKRQGSYERFHATDCKSLCECIVQSTTSLEEVWTLLDVHTDLPIMSAWNMLWGPIRAQTTAAMMKDSVSSARIHSADEL